MGDTAASLAAIFSGALIVFESISWYRGRRIVPIRGVMIDPHAKRRLGKGRYELRVRLWPTHAAVMSNARWVAFGDVKMVKVDGIRTKLTAELPPLEGTFDVRPSTEDWIGVQWEEVSVVRRRPVLHTLRFQIGQDLMSDEGRAMEAWKWSWSVTVAWRRVAVLAARATRRDPGEVTLGRWKRVPLQPGHRHTSPPGVSNEVFWVHREQ